MSTCAKTRVLSEFACYFPAKDPIFLPVNILSDDWVEDLLRVIRDELKSPRRGREGTYHDLRLYKTDILIKPRGDLQSRVLRWLYDQLQPNSHLDTKEKLTSFFPNGPSQSDDMLRIHIIIADAEVLELAKDVGDPGGVYKRKVKKALDQRLNDLNPNISPSVIVHFPDKVAGLLGCKEPPIQLGRTGGPPVAIFNPALATLEKNLENLEQLEVFRPDAGCATEYLKCAVAFYDVWHEDLRQKSITELISRGIGKEAVWRFSLDWADNIKPGGCWWHDSFLVMILELKGTLGLSGDALLQAAIYYSKIVAHEKYKRFREYTNFPVVLIGATANRLEISIAVCVGSIYVSKLLSLDLSFGFHTSKNIIRLARVFKALLCCRVDLQNYYNGVSKLASPRLSCLYPNPTPADPSKTLPKLVYHQFLTRTGQLASTLANLGNITTAMYIATLDDTSQEVVVKFTARYNEEAHRILAEAQLAPRLHYCERVIGDLYMVVMDRVDGKSIWQLQEERKPVPEVVFKMFEDAVLLHERNIVFGDLRDPNILYVASKGSDKGCVNLVDFDWPEKNREGRYPAALNLNNTWPEEVLPYGIMRLSHDLWQLDRLKALCVPGV